MNALTKATRATTPLSEARDRELLKDARSYVYQAENGFERQAHCFFPENHNSAEPRPAIVFFHGGLWDVSMATQFAPHCIHFASRGMVAVAVEYRVASTHQSAPEDALEDARIAMLWLKYNHKALGIDPDRVVAAGAASGAHMALSLAMLPQDTKVEGYSPRPFGVIALSAIVDTTKKSQENARFRDPKLAHKRSLTRLVRKGLCPMLIVHGKSDTIVPHEPVARFAKALKRKKNQCEFIEFEAANHSFFNFNVSAKHFELTLNSMSKLYNFLVIHPLGKLPS